MSSAKRWMLWLALLAGALGLVAFGQRPTPVGSIVEASPERAVSHSSSAAASRRAPAETPMISALRPRNVVSKIDDAFPVRDWRPPRPPPAKPGPPPVPVAPPLPYTVLGKTLQDGQWQVFLRRNEQILVVKSLDTIDNAYRVDEIRPPVMTLTYLPLQQRQTLAIGGAE